MKLLLVAAFMATYLSSSVPVFAQVSEPTLTKMSFSWRTTDEDKDWDTRVGVEVVCDGHDIAQFFGFNHDKKNDHWSDQTDQGSNDLPVAEHVTKRSLDRCHYRVSAEAKCNDHWKFEAHLHAEFSDQTQRNWAFLNGDLNSTRCQVVAQDFDLSAHHD